MTVANKPGHRGEHEVAVKTIARGMPGDPGVTVVTNARVYYTTRAAAGASDARHSLRPLMFRGYWFMHDSGAFAPRGRGGIPRRHCELSTGLRPTPLDETVWGVLAIELLMVGLAAVGKRSVAH